MTGPNPTPLATRLEEAEASRELDAEIVAFFANAIVKPYPPSDDFGPKDRWQFWSRDGEHFLGSEGKFPVKPYTSSLDAALALVGEKLPGWWWHVGHNMGPNPSTRNLFRAAIARPGELGRLAIARTPALALLAALLKALAQSPEATNAE